MHRSSRLCLLARLLPRKKVLNFPRPHAIPKHVLNNQDPLDLIFQALADRSRRAILERLTRGLASVSELAQPLEMSLPAVVQHLQVLESGGLIKTEKIGRVRTCTIETPGLPAAEHWISERRTTGERRLDRLGEYLAGTTENKKE